MTISYANIADSPGAGATSPVRGLSVRQLKVGVYTVTLDSAQAAGGESVSDIWNDFSDVYAINCSQVTGTIANLRLFTVDFTNKKLIAVKTLSSGANSEETGSLDTIVVRLTVIGV